MPDFSPALVDLLERQDNVVTRAQLLAGGLSKEAVRWNAGRHWRVVLPNTMVIGREGVSLRQRHIAALLYAGPGAAITADAATEFHGLRCAAARDLIEVVTPPNRRRRNCGFVSIRPSLLVDHQLVTRGPLSYVSVGRACVDAATPMRSDSSRKALFIEAVQKRLVSLDELAEWVHRLRPRDAAALHQALAAAASGAWSLPEHRLLELISTSSVLPAPWPNTKIEDTRGLPLLTPDVWFDDVAMAVMVHSRRHHSEAAQWDATVSRDADLVAAGVIVVGVTPRQIEQDPRGVLARIEAAHANATTRPRPDVTAYENEGWKPLTVA